MSAAWSELGQHELAGAASNPRIRQLFRDAGHAEVTSDDVAWCAAFVGACLERSGFGSTRSLAARSYAAWGDALESPRLGAIAVLSRGADPALGHVGFWLGETADAVLLLGGNQSNAVSVAPAARSRLIGYRWPSPALAVSPPLDVSRTSAVSTPAFEAALTHVLEMEGGFSDDPYDPGGPTNLGITLADFARFRHVALDGGHRDALVADLRHLGRDEAAAIYLAAYWKLSRAGDLPPALGFMHFDAAVNQGVGAAARLLQEAVGTTVDGAIGPLTLGAARSGDVASALARYAELRRQRYRSLPHFWRFGRGWLKRVDTTLARALDLADRPAVDAAPAIPSEPNRNGDHQMPDATPPADMPVKWWGNSLTIWGAIVTAATTVAPAVAPALGFDLTPELVRQVGDQTVHVVQAVGGLAGTLMTIYGRSRATSLLGRREFRLTV